MKPPLQLLAAELATAITGLTAAETQARPLNRPDRWSIQQIIEHLTMSYETTAQVLEARIQKARPTQASPTLVQRAAQFVIIGLGRFPNGRKAPAAVTPSVATDPQTGNELALTTRAHLGRLNDLTTIGDGLFGRKRAASHLVLGPLSMDQWRVFHLVHGRHHIRQITLIRQANHI